MTLLKVDLVARTNNSLVWFSTRSSVLKLKAGSILKWLEKIRTSTACEWKYQRRRMKKNATAGARKTSPHNFPFIKRDPTTHSALAAQSYIYFCWKGKHLPVDNLLTFLINSGRLRSSKNLIANKRTSNVARKLALNYIVNINQQK